MSYEKEKYLTNPDQLKETIEKYGVGIIPNILNKDQINKMRDGMWDYLEHITQSFETQIDRNNNRTWVEFLKLYPKHSMLLQNYGVGHSQFVWDIRQNNNIINIFSKFWKTNELLTSFDGASFHFPPEYNNRGWFRKVWYHTDQSYMRPDFECLQSWVTAYDVDEGDATLAFLEKSNIYHKDFQEKYNIKDKSDWYKLNEEEQSFYINEKKCEEKRIKCDAGSMVFWDSRTIHCGTEAIRKRKNHNIRNIVYVCMTPKSLATPAYINKKQKAFHELRMTSHWPHKPKLFPKNPRTYGGPLPNITPINKPILTELGMKVAGF